MCLVGIIIGLRRRSNLMGKGRGRVNGNHAFVFFFFLVLIYLGTKRGE
jgi:hypothetical protein